MFHPKLNTNLVFILIILVQSILFVLVVSTEDEIGRGKSLFDDLPYNGAFNPETSGLKLVKPSIQSIDVKLAIRNSKETSRTTSEEEFQPKDTDQYQQQGIENYSKEEEKQKAKNDDTDLNVSSFNNIEADNTHENSLFNTMPNKGAINDNEDPSSFNNPSGSSSSTQKRSFLVRNSPAAAAVETASRIYYNDYKNLEHDHSVVKSPTAFSPQDFNVYSSDGAIPIITSTGVRVPLIVTKRKGQSNIFDATASSPEFNKLPPTTTTPSYTLFQVSSPIPVVHRNVNTEVQVQSHYFPTRTEFQHNNFDSKRFNQRVQPPPSRLYGPPSNQPQNSPQHSTEGTGYSSVQTTAATPLPTFSPQPATSIPIIIGPSSSTTSSSVSQVSADYDYNNLEYIPHAQRTNFQPRTGSYQLTISGGTGVSVPGRFDTPPPASYSATSWGDPQSPSSSSSYGPPAPIHDITQPSPSYGPPLPSYGPPEVHPPAPPPPRPASPPAGTSVTSISYQTIPVQTVHTELVTVPHITVSSSSAIASDSEISQDTPSKTPQTPGKPISSYGPPSYNSYNTNTNVNRQGQELPAKRSGSLFTDDQIAALIAFNQQQQSGLTSSPATYNNYNDDELSLYLLANQARLSSGVGLGVVGASAGTGITGLELADSASLTPLQPITPTFQLPTPPVARSRGFSRGSSSLNPFRFLNPFRNNNNNNIGLHNNNNRNRNIDELLAQQRYANRFNQNFAPVGPRYAVSTFGSNSPTILTKDAVQAVNDLVQEQRLRNSVVDLRTRLQYEGQNTQRAREDYRSLFYKGAMLLGALTLIPAMASPAFAAMGSSSSASAFAAGMGSAGAAGSPISHLLPLSVGRKRRNIIHTIPAENNSPFNNNCSTILKESGFNNWLNCAENATISLFEEEEGNKIGNGTSTTSMFDLMAFKGALVPASIRENLLKFITMDELKKNSECIQKRFCETLKQIETLPNGQTIFFNYSIFAGDVDSNPWIREAMTGGRNNNCEAFFCFEDYK